MKCDIIIPIWGQLDYTKECIENIVKNTRYPYRLILIDNASDDETRQYLEGLKGRDPLEIELIRNNTNLGFVKAVNQGLKISQAPYACVLNNDTIPAPGWLERMIDFAVTHKEVGLVNPQCNGHLNTPIEVYAKMLEGRKGEYMEMNQCQGFCMLIKRELIDKIGYLDESYGIGGYDDTDYSMRAHKAGFRCVAINDAYVYHRLHGSFSKSGDREDWVKRNRKIYYDKWGRHLRIGIILSSAHPDTEAISNLMKLAYGLAREWSWVHIWINSKLDRGLIKSTIEEARKNNGLPPHQNIRIDYFNLPGIFFKFTILGKVLERMRRRMQDKRFDAILAFDDNAIRFIKPFSGLTGTKIIKAPPYLEKRDWEEEGMKIATSVKK